MSHSGISGPLVTSLAASVRASGPLLRKSEPATPYEQLELRYAALQKEYADLHAALFEAAQVYRRMCAPRFVRRDGFEIASETFAARFLPGDFFTVDDTGDGILLGLGDISGKGLAAGMWTTLLLGLIATHRAKTLEPHVIIAGVNGDLCRISLGAPLASLFLARLDTDSGRLCYCSAGHPPAMLLRADGQLELLSDGGPLLGVVPEASFVSGSVEVKFGDVLVAYSDGILEARNYEDEEFGYDHLEAQLRRLPNGSADAALFSLLGAVQDFAGACPQADDISLVVVRRGA
jgi:sigma-B regulation protein RsbU (phosphoserine phosphatase)